MVDLSPSSTNDLEIVEVTEVTEGVSINGEDKETHLLVIEEDFSGNKTTTSIKDIISQSSNREDRVLERGENDKGEKNGVGSRKGGDIDNGSDKGENDDEGLDDVDIGEVDFTVGRSACTSRTDIKSIRSRVFIGHLNTDEVKRCHLVKLFRECGKVVAISIFNDYGFVQYADEDAAKRAIKTIHGKSLCGRKLVVDKPELWKRLDGEKHNERRPWPKIPNYDDADRRYRDSSERERRREREGRREREARRERERRREREHTRDSEPYHHHHEARSHYYDDRYYDDRYYDNVPAPRNYCDPYYERYLEARYMEERFAERYGGRYDHYPPDYYRQEPAYKTAADFDNREHARAAAAGYHVEPRGYGQSLMSSRYDRPRDDEYDRRRPFDGFFH